MPQTFAPDVQFCVVFGTQPPGGSEAVTVDVAATAVEPFSMITSGWNDDAPYW
jgi:hypothetical protein